MDWDVNSRGEQPCKSFVSQVFQDNQRAKNEPGFGRLLSDWEALTYDYEPSLITIISSDHGPIVKQFSYVDGEVHAEQWAQVSRGKAKTVALKGPEELLRIITSLKSNEALSLGRLQEVGRTYPLTSEGLRREGEISRTKSFLFHHEGPAWMLLDVDVKGLPPHILEKINNRNLYDVIVGVVPELACAPTLVRPSSSAGITLPDGSSRPASGLHIYVQVNNGLRVQQLIELIHNRLWAAGLGFYAISKAGTLLDRSLVDTAVGGAERLVFEAAPIVLLPLKRHPPQPVVHHGDSGLGEVVSADMEAVGDLKARARESVAPEAKAKRKCHEEEHVVRVAEKLLVPKNEARRIVKQRLDMQVLNDDDVLETARGRFETVSQFLDRTTTKTALPCPFEGSEYGLSTAYFFPADERSPIPRIISFAHGDVTPFSFARFSRLRGLEWL